MGEQLSTWRIKRGRRVFDSYSAINSFSFALVTGNTITLFALALGASSTVVGMLGAFMYLSFFSIPIGKLLLPRNGLVKTFANNWMYRNWSLLPLLSVPWLVGSGHTAIALATLVLCVFAFNFFRGAGLIANNPVIGSLAPGRDRGEYIVRLSLINNATALAATALLALLLWKDSGIWTYWLVIVVGIATGIVASALLYRLPEPVSGSGSAEASGVAGATASPSATATRPGFVELVAERFKQGPFARFMASYLVIGLGIGMARPFIIVYCKGVYGQTDGIVTVFTICSSLGAILMGAVMRLTIDRLGAKPMYVIFAAVSCLSLVPAIVSPGIGGIVFPIVFLCALSAVTNMGFAGQESAAQTYFFAMVSREEVMDLSMLYYFVLGGTGAIGSAAGGLLLDALAGIGFDPLASFRTFFAISAAIVALGIYLQRGLPDLGSYPVRDSLAVLFSPRDMRALTLLRKLDANDNPDNESRIIAELGETASPVSSESLAQRLSSPLIDVRLGALHSVESMDRLGGSLRDCLIRELSCGEFATADKAAMLIGKFGVRTAIPALRKAMGSADYRLVGESMLALARLNDDDSLIAIGTALETARESFTLSRGVQAMEVFRSPSAIPILIALLRREDLPPHVADEAILALAFIMEIPKGFFYAYGEYVSDRTRAASIIQDALDEGLLISRGKNRASMIEDDGEFAAMLRSFIADPESETRLFRWAADRRKGRTGLRSALLIGSVLDSDLRRLEPFRFFLCYWAACLRLDGRLIEK